MSAADPLDTDDFTSPPPRTKVTWDSWEGQQLLAEGKSLEGEPTTPVQIVPDPAGWNHGPPAKPKPDPARWNMGSGRPARVQATQAPPPRLQAPPAPRSQQQYTAPTPAPAPAKEARMGACFHFTKKGHCSRGDTCKYVHPKPVASFPAPAISSDIVLQSPGYSELPW